MAPKKAVEVFEEAKKLPKEEKKALYASMISSEDKIELYRLEKSSKFIPENVLPDSTEIYLSDSGHYELVVTQYKTGLNSWNYTLGSVYKIIDSKNKQLITTVQRNHKYFPYIFIEDHLNGHDYLICGEDYQGQTVVELDSGNKKSWIPLMGGFCWVNMIPSPHKDLIAVEGCYWGCPHNIQIFDFSNPLDLPFYCLTEDFDINKFEGWNSNNSCSIEIEFDTRKSDGKPIIDLNQLEQDALNEELEPGINQDDIFGREKKNIVWSKS